MAVGLSMDAFSLAIAYGTNSLSKKKAIFYTFIASLSEPIGAILTGLFLINYVNDTMLGLLFAFIAGIMIQISSYKLLPTGSDYNKKISYIFFCKGIF